MFSIVFHTLKRFFQWFSMVFHHLFMVLNWFYYVLLNFQYFFHHFWAPKTMSRLGVSSSCQAPARCTRPPEGKAQMASKCLGSSENSLFPYIFIDFHLFSLIFRRFSSLFIVFSSFFITSRLFLKLRAAHLSPPPAIGARPRRRPRSSSLRGLSMPLTAYSRPRTA